MVPRLLVLLLVVVAGSGCAMKTVNGAMAFGTGGAVDTDFPISEIDGKPFSITLKFMLRWPNSYYNAFVGESGDAGPFSIGKNANTRDDPPRLAVNVGGVSGVYAYVKDFLGGFQAGQWYWLAVTVDPDMKMRVYHDGALAFAVDQGASATVQLSKATPWATGNLRFGQRRATMDYPEQFWGLLDDVAVWNKALTPQEVATIAQGQPLTGNEDGLIAGWNFDIHVGGAQPPPKHGRPMTESGHLLRVFRKTTDPDTDAAWADKMIGWSHATEYFPPVKGAWTLGQGADAPPGGTHRGPSSHAIDIVSADANVPTRGAEVMAAADGTVIFIRDTSPDSEPDQKVPGCTPCSATDPALPAGAEWGCGYKANEVLLKHTASEMTMYAHLIAGSVPQSVKDKLVSGQVVQRGEILGKVGQSGGNGEHLHFGQHWTFLPVNNDVGANPGIDTPLAPCGYQPAVPAYGIVSAPWVFREYQLQTGNVWDTTFNEQPKVSETFRPNTK